MGKYKGRSSKEGVQRKRGELRGQSEGRGGEGGGG